MSEFCNPMHCSLPGSSIHGISQTRILEWVAISSSRRQIFFFKSLRHCKETCFFLNAKRNDWVFLNGRVASLTAKKLLCGEKLSKRMPEDFIFKGVSSREKNYCKWLFCSASTYSCSCWFTSYKNINTSKK